MNTTNYIVIEKCINCCAYEITRGKNDRQRVMDNIKERLTNPCIVASIVIDTKSRLAQTIKGDFRFGDVSYEYPGVKKGIVLNDTELADLQSKLD